MPPAPRQPYRTALQSPASLIVALRHFVQLVQELDHIRVRLGGLEGTGSLKRKIVQVHLNNSRGHIVDVLDTGCVRVQPVDRQLVERVKVSHAIA